MKTYEAKVTIVIDETNRNAINAHDIQLAIENALETPDNNEFGIKSIEVNVYEVPSEIQSQYNRKRISRNI